MTSLYTASAVATGDGRNGHVQSFDGILDADVRTPKELGGDGGATNPEQLFAAAYAASLLAAIRQIAAERGITVPADSNVTATIAIDRDGTDALKLTVALTADIPCIDAAEAREIVNEAMRVCPIARATCERVSATVNVD